MDIEPAPRGVDTDGGEVPGAVPASGPVTTRSTMGGAARLSPAKLFPGAVRRRPAPNPRMITAALNALRAFGPDVDRVLGGREPMVDEWEAGRLVPTAEQLDALAKLTYLPVGLFYLGADDPDADGDADEFRIAQLDRDAAVRIATRLDWLMHVCAPGPLPSAAALAERLTLSADAVERLLAGQPMQLSEDVLDKVCLYFGVSVQFFEDTQLALDQDTANRVVAGQLMFDVLRGQSRRVCGHSIGEPWRPGETAAETVARLRPEAELYRNMLTEIEQHLARTATDTDTVTPRNSRVTAEHTRHRRFWHRRR